MSERLLFGLAGKPGSGKSCASSYLVQRHGFHEFVGSEYLQKEAAQESRTLRIRQDYADYQRELRATHGYSFIIDAMLKMSHDRIVNVGIRNRLDVSALLKAGGIIISMYCPDAVRFSRTAGTDPKYPTDYTEFLEVERQEYNEPDPFGLHTLYTMDRGLHWIDSRRPIEEVHKALDEIVSVHSS